MYTNLEKNKKLLDSFIMDLKTSRASDCTIRSYITAINQFFEFYGDKDFIDIEYSDAEDFKNMLFVSNKSSNTIGLRISALSSFSKYVRKRVRKTNSSFENVFIDLNLPPIKQKKEKVIWNEKELIDLIELLNEKKMYTEACLVALDLYSGRRRSELLKFSVEDFSDKNLFCNNKFYKTNIIKTKGRNGGKFINCYILSEVKQYIDFYIDKTGITDGLLFKEIGDSQMGTFMRRINKLTNKHFHWHVGRHTFATSLYNSGVPEDIIVAIVGWESADMMKIYNDNTKDQKIEKFFA